ncbi:hypothetical protein CAOG_02141 [Capsaspora owczarzaki ATCC 30864]|uniref:hypothetical protein n=1 Tax=Capsaspora owczarzaki (strain ATCC 30864) TaxID=595528 RepID=UPI0001FE29EE|nr:hypothetical protein CAOG_02141 [Capsaspora owczarzaki ATCC 30864]|eukprot:XP_004348891.1 hypothetical protein CAOG_02141 [Capsaspora owczarzaki ATCC 30864]
MAHSAQAQAQAQAQTHSAQQLRPVSTGDPEDTATIVQGMLCPMCMKDLRTITKLQEHWEEAHANEDKAIFSTLTSWFKSKGKGAGSSSGASTSNSGATTPTSAMAPGGGVGGAGGGDDSEFVTRAHWEDDSASSVCREDNCNKEFGFRERRHHCRKCGRLFCGEHCMYQIRLNALAQHDLENGVMSKVCRGCFEGRTILSQTFGASRSWTKDFQAIRRKHNGDLELSTNQRLNRLDKLLSQLEKARSTATGKIMLTPTARKAAERAVVDWEDDSKVSVCRTCARSFGLRNRRHHCRLCGFVVCGEQTCSDMLSLRSAKRLTDNAAGVKARKIQLTTDAGDEDLEVRVCHTCVQLMFRRATQAARAKARPPQYAQIYERLAVVRKQIEELFPRYRAKAEKANDVSNPYRDTDRGEGLQLKAELSSLFDQLDKLSQEIYTCKLPEYRGTEPEPAKDKAKRERKAVCQMQIQNNIRSAAVAYRAENLIQLELLSTRRKGEAAPAPTSGPSVQSAPPPQPQLSQNSQSIPSLSQHQQPHQQQQQQQQQSQQQRAAPAASQAAAGQQTQMRSFDNLLDADLSSGNRSNNRASSSFASKPASGGATPLGGRQASGVNNNALSLQAQVALEQRDRVKAFIAKAEAEGREEEAATLRRELENMTRFMQDMGLMST